MTVLSELSQTSDQHGKQTLLTAGERQRAAWGCWTTTAHATS